MDEVNLDFNNSFNSIVNNYSKVSIPVKEKTRSERAELVSFFVENLKNKKGQKFPKSMVAIKLSHIPTKDLPYMISIFKDTFQRKGAEAANKEFWWSIR